MIVEVDHVAGKPFVLIFSLRQLYGLPQAATSKRSFCILSQMVGGRSFGRVARSELVPRSLVDCGDEGSHGAFVLLPIVGNYQSFELQGSERAAKVAREANDSRNVVKSTGGVCASHSLLPCLLDVGAANN